MLRLTAGRTPMRTPRALCRRGTRHRGRPREANTAAAPADVLARLPPRDGGGQIIRSHARAGPVRHHRLGRWADTLRRPPVLGMPITLQEATVEWHPTYSPERFDAAEVQQRIADHRVACGQALIAALLDACLTRGIEPVLEARACELAMQGDRVAGLVVDHGGRRIDGSRPGGRAGVGGLRVERHAADPLSGRSADPSAHPPGQRGGRAARWPWRSGPTWPT